MTLVLSIISIVFWGIALSCLYKNKDLIEITILALVAFIFSYIISSGLLLWVDMYAINRGVFCSIMEAVVLCAIMMIMNRVPFVSFACRKNIIPLVIFIIVLPVTFLKFGFFGMGQDQGVYQTKAIAFIYGNESNTYNLDELDTLSSEEQALYKAGISQSYGFYMYNDNGVGSRAQYSTGQGVFHGIPTYPAVLALWGEIFGYQNMAGINTLIFMCCVLMLYYTCGHLKMRKTAKIAVTALYAISPIVLWVTKSSLSENITMLIFISFIYFISDVKNKHMIWISSIPIITFTFLHVSVYVLMPLFVIIYFVMYLAFGKKQYLINNIVISVSYKLGYMMMLTIAQVYTRGNYGFISRIGISVDKMPLYSTIAVVIVCTISIVLIFVPYKKGLLNKLADNKMAAVFAGWAMRLIMVGSVVYLCIELKKSVFSVVNATMYAYIAASAIIVIPLLMIVIFIKPKLVLKNTMTAVFGIMFFYCVILYAALLSPYVSYYNYYSRYITVYISILMVFAALIFEGLIDDIKLKRKRLIKQPDKLKNIVYISVTVFAIILYIRYDVFMIDKADETRIDWEIVEDVTDMLGADDALIIDGELKNQLLYTTKLIKHNKVYPVMGNLNTTIEIASRNAQNIYYIKYNPISIESLGKYELEKIYEKDSHFKIYDKELAKPGHMPYTMKNIVAVDNVFMYKVRVSE